MANALMDRILPEISQSISTCVMNALIFLFFRRQYTARYSSRLLYGFAWLAAVCVMLLVNQIGLAFLNLLYTILYANVLCLLLFRASLKQAFLPNLIFLFVLFFSDAVTFSIWSVLLGAGYEQIRLQGRLTLVSNFLNILVMLLGYWVSCLLLQKRELERMQVRKKLFLLVLFVWECFLADRFMRKVSQPRDGVILWLLLCCSLLLNGYICFLIRQGDSSHRYQYELSLAQRQSKLQITYCRNLEESCRRFRKILHDLKKHFLVEKDLEKASTSNAQEYQQLVSKEFGGLFSDFSCENPVLRVVMGQKLEFARQKKIRINLYMDDSPLEFLSNLEVTALFSNLWDNAIESCMRVEPKERFILFALRQSGGCLTIHMENSTTDIRFGSGQRLVSAKKHHTGTGFKILQSITEKYDGFLHFHNQSQRFSVDLVLPVFTQIRDSA